VIYTKTIDIRILSVATFQQEARILLRKPIVLQCLE